MEDVATPEAFERQPDLVHEFYNTRRRQLLSADVAPNAAHHALARLEKEHRGSLLLITQNVDNLHERAGSRKLLHMHGELLRTKCAGCRWADAWVEDLGKELACPNCGIRGGLRPDIVWFGEMPLELDHCFAAVEQSDLFISIGTSGVVYPAAGFVDAARNALTIEINLAPSERGSAFLEHRQGQAGIEVPALVESLLA